jgi:hypothetical protein
MRNRRMPRWLLPIALVACGACGAAGLLHAQGMSGIIGLNEEESRFVPGLYYFHKGCDYFRRGYAQAAVESWQIAAGWAMKDAQYDLGIAYFRGRGIAIDRPRGLAWLALAAERKDEAFEISLAAAWDEATPDEHARANEIWRDLRKEYADEVALVRARNRYDQEVAHITGSRVGMPGHVRIWTRDTGVVDVVAFKSRLEERAERNFGKLPTGTVDIGPLEPVIDEAPPEPPAH